MSQLQVSLSRAHKIAERLKDLYKTALADLTEASNVTSFSAKPAPSVIGELALTESKVFALSAKAAEYSRAWAYVRSVIAGENEKRGISRMLAELEAVNLMLVAHKTVVANSKEDGYLPGEVAGYQPMASTYAYGLTVNPLREPETAKTLAAALTGLQSRAIQLSDEISEANAPRVTLELERDILAEVTGAEKPAS